MILEGLIPALSRARTLKNALGYASASADFSLVDGLRAPLIAGLLRARKGPTALLAVVATGRDSESLREALASVAPAAEIIEFPAWETLPFERVSPGVETMGQRLRVLWRLRDAGGSDAPPGAGGEPGAGRAAALQVVVASVRALLQRLGPGVDSLEPVVLRPGRQIDRDELVEQLVVAGYRREYQVEHRGEVSVRGSIERVTSMTS